MDNSYKNSPQPKLDYLEVLGINDSNFSSLLHQAQSPRVANPQDLPIVVYESKLEYLNKNTSIYYQDYKVLEEIWSLAYSTPQQELAKPWYKKKNFKINKNTHRVTKLSLASWGLKKISDSIGNLTDLEYLNLNNNELTKLPETIGNLTNLKELYLLWNYNIILPDSMANLSKLEKIDLPGIKESDLKWILQLKNLKVIWIRDGMIDTGIYNILAQRNIKLKKVDTSL
ncbi:MAG: hypothetical protein Q7S33_02585 [Nanoarchaeota archaeon]|nr:hypothetical protein [Nanoarchaeota archaeon]